MTLPLRARVRSRQDGTIGRVLDNHRDFPEDPWLTLVRWPDHTCTWHKPETLELVHTDLPDEEERTDVMALDIREHVGRALAAIRAEHGLSQAEFAPRIGLTRPYLADIETGRSEMTLSTFAAICTHLKIDPNKLLGIKL